MWTRSKHRLNFFLLALGAALWSACDDTDSTSLFRETPTKRIDNTEVGLQEALTRPEGGFRAVYFPSPSLAGGFTFFMKFAEDGTVKMTSNVDADTEIRSSRYGITYGSTIELAFQTRNHIHKLSQTGPDAGVAPITSGYGGNSSFQYDGMQDDVIVFRELRNEGYMRLEPLESEETWLPTLEELQKNRTGLLANLASDDKPVFQVLEVRQNGALIESSFASFDPALGHLEVATTEGSETLNADGYGVAFLEDRIEIQPPITSQSGEEMIRYMTPTGDGYTAREGALEASISFSEELPSNALAHIEDLDELIEGGKRELDFYDSAVQLGTNRATGEPIVAGTSSEQTAGFSSMVNRLKENARSTINGDYILTAFILPENKRGEEVLVYFGFRSVFGVSYIGYSFTASYDEKRIYLTDVQPLSVEALLQTESTFREMLDFFQSKKGLYFKFYGKGFTTNTANFGLNPSVSLTSLDDPTLRAYGLIP